MDLSALKFAVFPLLVLAIADRAAANESHYTDLDLNRCATLSEDDLGASFQCAGYLDYPVYVSEGDLRQTVFFGHVKDDYQKKGFESFSQFNYVGSKIEWRVDPAGKPVAAILRWMIENPEGESEPAALGQVLVISRVAQKKDGISCVAGYVDALANKDANVIARQVADETAPDFACGAADPAWHGERGTSSGEPARQLPDSPPGK